MRTLAASQPNFSEKWLYYNKLILLSSFFYPFFIFRARSHITYSTSGRSYQLGALSAGTAAPRKPTKPRTPRKFKEFPRG